MEIKWGSTKCFNAAFSLIPPLICLYTFCSHDFAVKMSCHFSAIKEKVTAIKLIEPKKLPKDVARYIVYFY